MAAATKKRGYGNGSLYQRTSDGRWVGAYIVGIKANGKPDKVTVYGKTEAEARKKLDAAIVEARRSDYIRVQKGSVRDYMLRWLNSVKRLELKDKSFDRLEQTLEADVFPYIGHLQVADLQSSDVQNMITSLFEKKRAYSTIKKAYDAVHGCFEWGLHQRPPQVKFNPTDGVTKPSKSVLPPKQISFYSSEEAERIAVAALKAYPTGTRIYRLGAGVILLLNTGLRLGEAVALEWKRDIDLEKKTLTVHGNVVKVRDRSENATKKYITKEQSTAKTDAGTNRVITLNDDALFALEDLKKVTGQFQYVFSTKQGNRSSERDIDKLVRRVITMAGFPPEKVHGPHSLRHTFATLLLKNKTDIKTVSTLLGHSDVTITYNTYIHVIQELQAEAIESLPSVTGGLQQKNEQQSD